MKHRAGARFIVGTVFVLLVAYGLWHFNSELSSFLESGKSLPVRALRIDGVLTHVTKRQVADLVGHAAGGRNITSVDTSELREALLAEPWIARAAVHRKMPDTLVVSLVEHVPAAYWNNDGLYDAQNQEIFKPDLRSFSEPLVRLGAYRDNLAPEVYESAVTFIRILEPRAAVHRKMPDTLVVSLVEHVPAAYWNNDGLYDAQNQEIFKPDLRSFSEPLVRLGAYRDNLAPEVYESAVTFIRILEPSRYHMVALYLDQVRCYTITLSGGTKLILGRGREKSAQRLERLLKSLPLTDINLADVSYVDLRYDVGFAVGPLKDSQKGESQNDKSVPQE